MFYLLTKKVVFFVLSFFPYIVTDNRQPSPNWKTFNVEDIAVYRDPLVIHKNSQSASSSSKNSDSGIVISSSSESSSKTPNTNPARDDALLGMKIDMRK